MKFLQLLIWTTLAISPSIYTDPLLVIILMIKNEEHSVTQTIEPLLKHGLDSFFILDTGSQDNTIQVTQDLFNKYNIQNAYIDQSEFIDFASSRNQALQEAEKTFPKAQYFLMIDADWHLYNTESLLQFCREQIQNPIDSFLIKIIMNQCEFYTQRLFKAHHNIYFTGAVHENINRYSTIKVPDTYITYTPSSKSIEQTKLRWQKDKQILLKEIEKNPNNPRTLFYLAQTFDCLQELDNACIWYTKRCQITSWNEEDFMSHYRLAQIYERKNIWEKALYYHLQAYNIRPTRAEPLINIAKYYLQQQEFQSAFLFAQQAIHIDFPADDILFINKHIYEFERYDILSIASWYIQQYDIGKEALLKALQKQPTNKRLLQNLQFYHTKML